MDKTTIAIKIGLDLEAARDDLDDRAIEVAARQEALKAAENEVSRLETAYEIAMEQEEEEHSS